MEKKICKGCEKEVEDYIEVDGDIWCKKCIENNLDIVQCADCGEYHYIDNLLFIEDSETYVCEDCFSNGDYFQCDDCGFNFTTVVAHEVNYGNRTVCDNCLDNYDWCECCDTYIYQNDTYYCEGNGRYYCEQHYEEHNDNIYDYHDFSNWHPKKANHETCPPYYIGFELEIETSDDDNNYLAGEVKEMFPVICAHDGSLDNGFEIISHPLSYKYYIEYQEKLKNMLSYLKEQGAKSHDTTTCGLHFHVTHPHNEDIIDRIILIMETYKEELIKFSRRTSSQINQWCKFLSDYKETHEVKSLYYIKKNKETSCRYMALNLTNSSTIEFRLFRGTLNFDTFMASVELVNNIVTLCSDLNIPVEEITWDKLTETQYAHTYCDIKNIKTTIIPHSNDEKYLEEERKVKEYKERVLKKLHEIQGIIKDKIVNNGYNWNDIELITYNLNGYISDIKHLQYIGNYISTLLTMCNNDGYGINKIKSTLEGLFSDVGRYIENINNHNVLNNYVQNQMKEWN